MIEVNGAPFHEPAATVAQLLRVLGHAERTTGLAVAVNGEVVPRNAWATRPLREGDRVDVVGAVQGG